MNLIFFRLIEVSTKKGRRTASMRGAFGWLGDKFIKALVMESDICFQLDDATR